MSQKHTLDELNNLSREELITMVLMMQGQLDTLNDNIEKLIDDALEARYGLRVPVLRACSMK